MSLLEIRDSIKSLTIKLRQIQLKINKLNKAGKNTNALLIKKEKYEQKLNEYKKKLYDFEYEVYVNVEALKSIIPEYLGLPIQDSVVDDDTLEYIKLMQHEFMIKKTEE